MSFMGEAGMGRGKLRRRVFYIIMQQLIGQ